MYSTYIIESESSGKLYINQTNNLEARINRHNKHKNFSTKNRGLWKLIFHKEFYSRSEAMAFEKKLKSYKNKEYIINRLKIGDL